MREILLTINEILKTQEKLNVAMGNPMGMGQKGVKENVLAAIVELVEVLDEINWKSWKLVDKEVNRQDLLTEMIDVLQFWANMVNCMGFTADDVAEALSKKWSENVRRVQANETTRA